MAALTAVLIGAGDRGENAYGNWAANHRDKLIFTAVAEPLNARRDKFADAHGIFPERRYKDWKELFAAGKLAEICIIATQDQMHAEPALQALGLGYHVLLEKPMATTLEECKEIVEASERSGTQLRISHVLRYTPFFMEIKKAVEAGLIGNIININHNENVSYWHFAHSYVRGHWRRVDESSPIVLAKTSHDLDILYWLVDSPVCKVSSFGSLLHYTADNAPEGAAKRCLDGCAAANSCQWYAPRLYLNNEPVFQIGLRSRRLRWRIIAALAMRYPGLIRRLSRSYPPLGRLFIWDIRQEPAPGEALPGEETILEELRRGPYGRCVYFCDNDVNDHQTVNLEFANGVTATMTVHGFASTEGRWIRIQGTRGNLYGKFTSEHQQIVIYDHHHVKRRVLLDLDLVLSSHLGGDDGLMASFVSSLTNPDGQKREEEVLTSARACLESHLIAFAADLSQRESRIVEMQELRENHHEEMAAG